MRFERSLRDLRMIHEKAQDLAVERGLQPLGSGTDMPHNQIDLRVVVATDADQWAMDERFGDGAVHLMPALTPV